MNAFVNPILKSKINQMPNLGQTVEITESEFMDILLDPNLVVVEKHFHNHLETNQVLFVIKGDEIDYVAVKEITDEGTRIFKEIP